MKRTLGVATSLVALAMMAPMGPVATAGGNDHAATVYRAATGDLSQFGGARRIHGDQTDVVRQAAERAGAKNVILIIGDGMGSSELTIARDYLLGAGKAFKGLDAMVMSGWMTHYTLHKDGKPDYVGDSAGTGTAWATGTKSYDGAISVDIKGAPHQTVLEWAKQTGRATGDVTTSEIQDATPAVLVSHVTARKCYGPTATTAQCPTNAKENGGLGSISEQLLDTRPDVTIGGGSATFAEQAKAGQWKGLTLEAQAKARGYQYVTDKTGLAAVRSADQRKPLLALVSPGNMPVKFAPYVATPGAPAAPRKCEVNPAWNAMPSLGDMTAKSIDLLSKNPNGARNGFFLQVESASIDKSDHAADVCGQIGETEQIDQAVATALDFAKKHGDTLVIVTADHAHTSQIVDGPGAGLNAALTTNEGSLLQVSYATSTVPGNMQHTGESVPVAAYGPGAANVAGLIDQTDLFFTMRDGMAGYDRKPGKCHGHHKHGKGC